MLTESAWMHFPYSMSFRNVDRFPIKNRPSKRSASYGPCFSLKNIRNYLGLLVFSISSTKQRKGAGARSHHVNCAKNFLNYNCVGSGKDYSGSNA